MTSRYSTCRFCPHCGVETLERDFYAQGGVRKEPGHRESVGEGCEYICRICGFGFRIMKSRRTQMADELHREHRRMRNSVEFKSTCVGSQVTEAFERAEKKGEW